MGSSTHRPFFNHEPRMPGTMITGSRGGKGSPASHGAKSTRSETRSPAPDAFSVGWNGPDGSPHQLFLASRTIWPETAGLQSPYSEFSRKLVSAITSRPAPLSTAP